MAHDKGLIDHTWERPPLVRVDAHVEHQHVSWPHIGVTQDRRGRLAAERFVPQDHPREGLPTEPFLEEKEVDLEKDAEEQLPPGTELEQAHRVVDVGDGADAQLAGAGWIVQAVVEIEAEQDRQAGFDAHRDDHQVDGRAGRDLDDELDLGHVLAARIKVVEKDAVQQARARQALDPGLAGQQRPKAAGVKAHGQPALEGGLPADDERHRNGTGLDAEAPVHAHGGRHHPKVGADEGDVLAQQRVKDLGRVLQERQADAGGLLKAP